MSDLVRARVGQILDVMCELAQGELGARVRLPDTYELQNTEVLDDVYGISVALNMLAEELQATVIRKEQYERTLVELEHTQSQLLHSAKLASLGELAAGVAHELNQPLQIIGFSLDELRDAIADGDRETSDEILSAMEGQVDRGAGVVARLLAFSRREAGPQKSRTALNSVVEEAMSILGAQLASQGIDMRSELQPDLADVACNDRELLQVVTNLVINARDAVRGREHREISLRTMAEDSFACLEVADTGSGISATDLPRVFDPFFTTKGVGKGTGLGLSISHGIIRRHGGTIEALSEVERGTRVRITLPVLEAR
ncbi:MAG: ATP-binding protein [Myxococcota bacterium]